MRKVKRERLEEKTIQIGGIYLLRIPCILALKVRPEDNYFNNEWSPGLLDILSYNDVVMGYRVDGRDTVSLVPKSPEHVADAERIKKLQHERMLFRKEHGWSVTNDTALLLVSKAVVPALAKAGRQRTVLFQFLVGEKPAWFHFTERGCVQSFIGNFKFVKASKRKLP